MSRAANLGDEKGREERCWTTVRRTFFAPRKTATIASVQRLCHPYLFADVFRAKAAPPQHGGTRNNAISVGEATHAHRCFVAVLPGTQ